MSASDSPRRVHFQSPGYLVERLDAIAELFDKDRTDLLVEAIREYIETTADSETFQELVATKYCELPPPTRSLRPLRCRPKIENFRDHERAQLSRTTP